MRSVTVSRVPMTALTIQRGNANDAARLLALFDDAVSWLVARGQTAQWGNEPFSKRAREVERARGWAASGGLWFATDGGDADAGAIVLGDAPDYVPPPTDPEVYVVVLLTASSWRGRGVGAQLVAHAVEVARARDAEQLRVDCWAGVDALPSTYERLGFTRSGTFSVKGWPGAILVRAL